MPRPKAMPPLSPSFSGSTSGSGSSSDEEPPPPKASPPRLKKKPAAPKKNQRPPVAEEQQHQKTKPQQQTSSPSPIKKKPALNNNSKKLPPPVASSATVPAAAAADDSSSDEEASDPHPKSKPAAKPALALPRGRGPGPDHSSSTELISSSKPEELPPDKKRKRKQLQEAGDAAQEGDDAAAAAASGSSSKKLFQRVWTEEHEITLLRGMLDFRGRDGGAHPAASDINAFSAALRGEFSRSQIYEKIRRLRKKYERNLCRGKEGADPSFAKPHEQVAFELSKKVWPAVEGEDHDYGGDVTGVRTKDKGGRMGCQRAGLLYPMLAGAINLLEEEDGKNLLARSASRALESLKPRKARALEERWSKHSVAGAKYFLERARLKKDLLESLVKVLNDE